MYACRDDFQRFHIYVAVLANICECLIEVYFVLLGRVPEVAVKARQVISHPLLNVGQFLLRDHFEILNYTRLDFLV